MQPLRIVYLMEDTDLSGGVRVQLAHADALIERGHHVTIATRGAPLTWSGSRAEWRYVDHFGQLHADDYDFIVGTFWPTVRPAFDLDPEKAVHLCQGFEGQFSYYQELREQIEATYRLPIPKLVVSRSLIEICNQFWPDVTYIGQIVDEHFFRGSFPADNDPLRVLLTGAWQIDIKGVQEGYGAASHARWHGHRFDLIRVSPWIPSREEPSDTAAEFHVAISTSEMTKLVHSCDIFLAPNHHEEGFGLPAAEALAAGLPAILTRIPSFLSFADDQDFALFVEEGDAIQMGDCLIELLVDESARTKVRRQGRNVAEQFRAHNTARRLEEFFLSRLARRHSAVQ